MKRVLRIILALKKKKKVTPPTNFEDLDPTDWESIMPRH